MADDPAIALLPRGFGRLRAQFAAPPDFEPELPRADGTDRTAGVLEEVAHRLGENYPLLGSNPAESPERARKLFAANMHNVHLALVQLPQSWFGRQAMGWPAVKAMSSVSVRC
jgi:hypothetical protein